MDGKMLTGTVVETLIVVGSNTHQLFEFIGQAKQQPKRFHQEDDEMSVAVVITLLRLVLHLRQYYDALLLIILEAENKYHWNY